MKIMSFCRLTNVWHGDGGRCIKRLFTYMKHEVNFIHVNVPTEDRELVMGPFASDDGPILLFDDSHTMAHLLHMAGCFPSITQAKKNGWDKSVQKGYQQIRFGKSRLMIYILNIFEEETMEDPDENILIPAEEPIPIPGPGG